MPILHDDRLIGRLDASLDSNRSRLVVSALHFEAPISRTVTDTVDAELHALAGWLGAGEVVRV